MISDRESGARKRRGAIFASLDLRFVTVRAHRTQAAERQTH
jgi:hypothetical protein